MASRIEQDGSAALEFTLDWRSDQATHSDRLHAHASLWKDIWPAGWTLALVDKEVGDLVDLVPAPGQPLVEQRPDLFKDVKYWQLRQGAPALRQGRFYPQGVFDVGGIFASNKQPCRALSVGEKEHRIDLNHPLAGRPVTVTARVLDTEVSVRDLPGESVDWQTQLLAGPGMQCRHGQAPTDFFAPDGLTRQDQSPDTGFYAQPRLVGHVDRLASQQITDLYCRLLPERGAVLDLMSSMQSHLPEEMDPARVTGLGLNAEEMAANPRLGARVVHDLNADPALPFADGQFAAVVCALGVEYLTDPLAVVAQCARVLAPGGVLVFTFSNRYFTPKCVRVWQEMHEFERLGYALELVLRAGLTDVHTLSRRGWPRPTDDPHYGDYRGADPVYATWGTKAV